MSAGRNWDEWADGYRVAFGATSDDAPACTGLKDRATDSPRAFKKSPPSQTEVRLRTRPRSGRWAIHGEFVGGCPFDRFPFELGAAPALVEAGSSRASWGSSSKGQCPAMYR